MKNYYYTLEESCQIRKRVMEHAPDGPEAEIKFHTFLEQLRRNAELYASLLFRKNQTKLVDFDLTLGTASIRDEQGNLLSVSLQFKNDE